MFVFGDPVAVDDGLLWAWGSGQNRPKELAPAWRAYGVQVQASPDSREATVGHSAFVYGIAGSGSVLVIYPSTFEPSWIVHDAPLLATY